MPVSRISAIASLCLMCLAPSLATGIASSVKACPDLEVRSINGERVVPESKILGDPKPDRPPTLASEPTRGSVGQVTTIVAVGPLLGSMDSREVKTELECTAKGLALKATVTRSAQYNGSVEKNVLWRPEIEMKVVPRRSDVTLQTEWRMRLDTGAELKRAGTPPYPEQKYPIFVTRVIESDIASGVQ